MKSILDDLWFNYQAEISARLTAKKKAINSEVTEKQNRLFDTLTDEQKELFEQYLESQDIFQSASDKDCFIGGVSFAINFIMDAIKADGN